MARLGLLCCGGPRLIRGVGVSHLCFVQNLTNVCLCLLFLLQELPNRRIHTKTPVLVFENNWS